MKTEVELNNLFRCDMCHELYHDGKIEVEFNGNYTATLCYHCGREIQRKMQGNYQLFGDD
jgi:RNase P subunit RPR2